LGRFRNLPVYRDAGLKKIMQDVLPHVATQYFCLDIVQPLGVKAAGSFGDRPKHKDLIRAGERPVKSIEYERERQHATCIAEVADLGYALGVPRSNFPGNVYRM